MKKSTLELFSRLQSAGFTYDESWSLRRIEMTLHRWAELECGDGNDYCSWAIERDETTGKPYRCVYPNSGKMRRTRIADREQGALKRAYAIVAERNKRAYAAGENPAQQWFVYQQGDPRGCSLYLVRCSDIPSGCSADSYYSRGLAVCD